MPNSQTHGQAACGADLVATGNRVASGKPNARGRQYLRNSCIHSLPK